MMDLGGMFEMENPFKFGGLVTGKDFADRESEMAEILREVRGGTNIVLFSVRRMGKSSLLVELMRRHRGEFIWVYVDLYGVTTKSRLVEVYMSAIAKGAYGTAKKVAEGVRELVKGSRLRLVLNDKGEPGVELSMGEPTVPEIQEIMDTPEEIARKKRKRLVVVFDEFQEIGALDGVALLKAMRSRIQTHKHVSYIFAGSKRHLLLSIFEEREGAFYKSARPMELGPIPKEDFEKFVIDRFSASGGRIDSETASGVVEAARGNTYYAQQIAHELFDISPRPKSRDLESAITASLAHQSPVFQLLWDSVKSPSQRGYLLAVAREGRSSPRSVLIEKYGLKSHSHIQKAVSQLDARGVTENGEIVDPMFVLWLRWLAGGARQ
jgi:AAA+ ATPase superfamily predicted ATPase